MILFSNTYVRCDCRRVISVVDTLKVICDDEALLLFNTIVLANGDAKIHISKPRLTSKQYYSRLSKITNAGLGRRRNGKYFLTKLGKIVYDTQMTINKTLNYYRKIKTLEPIQAFCADFPKEELSKIIDTLMDDYQIKEILTKELISPSSGSRSTSIRSISNGGTCIVAGFENI